MKSDHEKLQNRVDELETQVIELKGTLSSTRARLIILQDVIQVLELIELSPKAKLSLSQIKSQLY